jgi:ABC-type multidrug transport system fused ATPase/permease subunit
MPNQRQGGTFLFLVAMLLGSTLVQVGGARAAKSLHADCTAALLHAPMSYFDGTPSGRLISRFSADLSTVDQVLAQFTDNWLQFTANILVLMALVVLFIPIMSIVAVFVFCGIWIQVSSTDRSTREVKRMANQFMSPVLTCATESIDARVMLRHWFSSTLYEPQAHSITSSGVPLPGSQQTHAGVDATQAASETQPMVAVPRASAVGVSDAPETQVARSYFSNRFDDELNKFLTANFVASSIVNWSLFSSYLVSGVFSTVCALYIVLADSELSPETAALALTYSFTLPYFLMFFGFICSNVKVALTSLERVLELLAVPQEPSWHLPEDETRPGWPHTGSIELRSVSLRYGPQLPLVVRGVTLSITSGERIGICGRTGAGKSSLVAMLFRLVDACEGSVLVSGVDITKVGLQTLRRCMGVIPQSPLLMAGTIRYNLDPFDEHSEERLQQVLGLLGMGAVTLDTEIGGGSRSAAGLSTGQRQLLSVGRVLLRPVKCVVMDEPTSNIDAETDRRMQDTLRGHFGAATSLTIAHRLQTIVDCDRVVVMGAGALLECAAPSALLDDPQSHFHAMGLEMGGVEALRRAALDKVKRVCHTID